MADFQFVEKLAVSAQFINVFTQGVSGSEATQRSKDYLADKHP